MNFMIEVLTAPTAHRRDHHTMIEIGARVRLQHLGARADLNGRFGQTVSYNAESGRYNVKLLDGGEERLALKPSNLALVAAAGVDLCVRLHLDPCLLPEPDDQRRWQAIRERAGYRGPTSRNAHPCDMMTFELSGRAGYEAGGSDPPTALVRLRELIAMLVLASEDDLEQRDRLGSIGQPERLHDNAVDGRLLAANGEPSRALLETQAVGVALRMVVDLNVALIDATLARLNHLDAEAVRRRREEQEEMRRWRFALNRAHGVTDKTNLDSLLDALGVGDGDSAGELRLPLGRLMSGSSCLAHAASDAGTDGDEGATYASRRFNALIIRQLLAKYELDDAAGLTSIREAIHSSDTDAAGIAARFSTSPEDTAALIGYFRDNQPPQALTQSLLQLSSAAVEATAVVTIRGLLSDDEIGECFRTAEALEGGARGRFAAAASSLDVTRFPHHVRYGSDHVAIFLHRDDHFSRASPSLHDKLIRTMCTQPSMYLSPQIGLKVRVIELHSYTPGDGLMIDGHRDQGSLLTMSVLLSDPSDFEGGTFATCAKGTPADSHTEGMPREHVLHPVQRGDAILFHSEKMHNVLPVTRGVRHALVLELWQQEANRHDRHS